MGTVIGDLLPLAVTIAISPVPVIAVILMLFAPRAGGASAGFLLGWVIGIVAAVVVFWLLAGVTDLGSSDSPSALASWVKLLLGALLVLLGIRQWRPRQRSERRSHGPPQPATLPGWMAAIDRFTAAKAAGLGFLLAAVNPKNLAMGIAAGVLIAQADLPGAEVALAVAVFTVIAACTVAVPVLGYAVARDRMRGPLDRLKTWLEANNAAVMSVLLLVIGVVLLGKGLGGLL